MHMDRHKIGPYDPWVARHWRTCFYAGWTGRVLCPEGAEDKLHLYQLITNWRRSGGYWQCAVGCDRHSAVYGAGAGRAGDRPVGRWGWWA
jgi:hypothetical protein